jgi:release factor glutamine methyltransferase
MLLKNYKSTFLNQLSFLNDEAEAESFFYIILEKLHKLKRIDLALNPNLELSEEDLQKWEVIITELKTLKPIQYILGETEFFGLRFEVNENTLIPRPETEELVELILVESRKSKGESQKILDVGTGSGCIAISLAKNLPNAVVSAIDVSEKAIETAKKNAENNKVNVNFILADVLKLSTLDFGLWTKFDVIVSNPPYVRNLEKEEIKANVLEFEPHLALFVEDNDALIFYRKIAKLAKKNLSENGKLYFEINQYLGKETVELLDNLGFKNVILKQDIYGNDRMISAEK